MDGILKVSWVIFLFMAVLGPCFCYAQNTIIFTPHETTIEGSIPYSVIGKYKAKFKSFKGVIALDQHDLQVQSVGIEIKSGSITSNCPWCDKIVCSARLLNAAKFPDIIFKSQRIIRDQQGFRVHGLLSMHGTTEPVSFPFAVTRILDPKTGRVLMDIAGRWTINRKAFHITWNKFLDHGGILVGDNITVNWGIKTLLKKEIRT